MDVGFKGNPNIGSVVLNQIFESDAFNDFATSFGQGDRIFIVSSIFGGTGAVPDSHAQAVAAASV